MANQTQLDNSTSKAVEPPTPSPNNLQRVDAGPAYSMWDAKNGTFSASLPKGITLASMIFTGTPGTFTFEFDTNSSSGTFEPEKCSAPILKRHHMTTQPGHPYPSCSDPIDIPGGRDGGHSGKLKSQVSQFHPRCAAEQYDTDMALYLPCWL